MSGTTNEMLALVDKAHETMALIGEGDWTPQDMLLLHVTNALRAAADQLEAVPSGDRWFKKAMAARGERERFRGIILAAPHSVTCYYEQTAHWEKPKSCDCWKADAILTADTAPQETHNGAPVFHDANGRARFGCSLEPIKPDTAPQEERDE